MPNQGITITVNAATSQAAAKLQEFFNGFSGNLDKLTASSAFLEELGAKVAQVFTVGALVEFTREAINTAEQMGKLSQQSGLAISTLSALKEAAHKVGIPFVELQVSLGLFSDKLFASVREGGPALRTFQDLGIKIVNADGTLKSVNTVLESVAQKFHNLPDGPQKTAAAIDLFGRSGRELIPILNQGAEGIERMRASGGPISEQEVADATHFNQSLRELTEQTEMLFNAFAKDLLPSLLVASREMTESAKSAGDLAGAIHFLADWVRGIIVAFDLLGTILGSLATVIANQVVAEIELLNNGVEASVELAKLWWDSIKAVFDLLLDLGSRAGSVGSILKDLATGDFASAKKTAGELISGGLGDLSSTFERLTSNARQAFGIISNTISKDWDLVKGMGQGTIDELADRWTKFWDRSLNLFGAGAVAPGGAGPGAKGGSGGPGAGAAPSKAPVSEEAKRLIEQIDKAWAESTQSKLKLLGIEEAELKAKIDKEVLDATLAEQKKTDVTQIYAAKRKQLLQKEEDEKHALLLAAIEGQKSLLQGDPDLTNAEKKEKLIELLKLENSELAKNVEIMRRRASDMATTDEARLQAEKQLEQLEQKRAVAQNELKSVLEQDSFKGEFKTVFKGLQDEWQSVAHQMATAFKNVFENAVSSISSGITGLIMQTKTWGQALQEIGTSILTSIVQAIVEMGVRWVLTQLMMAIAGKAILASSTAAIAPIALAQTAAWSVPATLATISSYGAAAAAAPGFIAAAEGLTLSESLALSFDTGGFTGSGSPSGIAGVVHNEEFVFSAPATRAAGVGRLEAIHDTLLGRGHGGSGSADNHQVIVLDERRRLNQYQSDPTFRKTVVEIMEQNQWRYSKG